MDYLKRVSDAANKLNKKKEELASKAEELENSEKEIKKLEIKKQEMEFLVKKASLSLFLQDQIERKQKKIAKKVESDHELKEILSEIGPLKYKLNKLEQEIKNDPNVDLLEEILFSEKRAISNEQNEYKDIIEFRPNFFGIGINMNQLARTIMKIMTN